MSDIKLFSFFYQQGIAAKERKTDRKNEKLRAPCIQNVKTPRLYVTGRLFMCLEMELQVSFSTLCYLIYIPVV